MGQSLGGPPSLSVAVRHPDRVAGVILAHSLGGINNDEIMAMVRADRAEAEKLPVIDRLMSKRIQESEPEKALSRFSKYGHVSNAARVPNLRNQWVGATTLGQVEDAIAAGVRVCFIAGGDDAVLRPVMYRRVAELLPEARVDMVPGAPHSMYWRRPACSTAPWSVPWRRADPGSAATTPAPPAERPSPARR